MTEEQNVKRRSATIYQFPTRGRFAAVRDDADKASRSVKTVGGAAWYHDDAIAEERKK